MQACFLDCFEGINGKRLMLQTTTLLALLQVKVDRLKGAPFAVLFSANGVPGMRAFLRDHLVPLYTALRQAEQQFEIVYVGNDANIESWRCGIQGMPWLAVPFSMSSSGVGDTMGVYFGVQELPTLVIVDRSGVVVTTEGVRLVKQLGPRAFPFSQDHVHSLGWRPRATDEESESSLA